MVNSSAFLFIFSLHMLCLVCMWSRSRIYVRIVLGYSRTWNSHHPMVNWIFVTLFIVIWWWQWWGSMFRIEWTFKTTQVALLRCFSLPWAVSSKYSSISKDEKDFNRFPSMIFFFTFCQPIQWILDFFLGSRHQIREKKGKWIFKQFVSMYLVHRNVR